MINLYIYMVIIWLMIIMIIIFWLVIEPYPSENDGVKISWDDDIPNIGKTKIHVPNHQPAYHFFSFIGVCPTLKQFQPGCERYI